MQNFIELLKDHALILAATNTLTAVVHEAEPRPHVAYDQLRRLARLLETHLRAEQAFIDQDQNHDDGRNEFAALYAEHGERFEDLVSEWATYLREWSEENISCDWAHFAQATDWIAKRLTAQVEAENGSLYPAALRYGLIRLLPEKVRAA